MKKLIIVFFIVLGIACVTKKPEEQVFIGVEKQELPEEFSGKTDETESSDSINQDQPVKETEDTTETEDQQENNTTEQTDEANSQEESQEQDALSTIIVVDEGASEDVVIVLEDSADQTDAVVFETESNVSAVPETNLIAIRSTDADRRGIIFNDTFVLKNYERMLEIVHAQDIYQIVIYCNSENYAVYTDLFQKLNDDELSFYLLFTDYTIFYKNRERIKNTTAIKGVIFWYEYWNFIHYKYTNREQAFEDYLKQLSIVTKTAKQYGLMCYSVVDWFTLEELQKIMEYPLQGLLLSVNDERIRIEEYIDTNLQLIRMTGLTVHWGILLNYKPKSMINAQADNEIIKLMKLYRDDPQFQGIIFLY